MIHHAQEGGISWFPELISSDLPHPLPTGLRLHARSGVLGIEAQGVVGSIPLKDGSTLQISPKIGDINFLRLLFRAEGESPYLDRTFEEFVEHRLDEQQNTRNAVARSFIDSVDNVLRRSLLRERKRRIVRSNFVAGRLLPVSSMANLAVQKDRPLVVSLRERSPDIPENRIISEALLLTADIVAPSDVSRYELIREAWIGRFGAEGSIPGDLQKVDRKFARFGYGGSRDYYRSALMLAKVILGASGLGSGGESTVAGDAFLLNTADIFERYIRAVMVSAAAPEGIVVEKIRGGVRSLYVDGSYGLEPDLLVSRNGLPLFIADAKYKIPSAADHYQLAVYMHEFDLQTGFLIAPDFDISESRHVEFVRTDRRVVNEIYLPMNDLMAAEHMLKSLIKVNS